MHQSRTWPCLWTLATLLSLTAVMPMHAEPEAEGTLRLPRIFGDHMVLQRDQPIPVWGWAEPGQAVAVSLDDQTAGATADSTGRWRVDLKPAVAGGPFTLSVRAGDGAIKYDQVMVGEVWLCFGQSNMKWPMKAVNGGEADAAEAERFPEIRLFDARANHVEQPQEDLRRGSGWRRSTPANTLNFSAVAYYFGRQLHEELDVPVGLIVVAQGSARIGAFLSPASFASDAELLTHAEASRRKKPDQQSPSTFFNGVLHPMAPYGIRGAAYYQGEQNGGHAWLYRRLLVALIRQIRTDWEQETLPFAVVQLPNTHGKWIWIRESQALAVRHLPATGLIVTMDTPEDPDRIHPRVKKPIGERLAEWALAEVYQRPDGAGVSPMIDRIEREGDGWRVFFTPPAVELVSRDGKPIRGFRATSDDPPHRKSQWQDCAAEIIGDTVRVTPPSGLTVGSLRYAFTGRPDLNLYTASGLPVAAARSDDGRGWHWPKNPRPDNRPPTLEARWVASPGDDPDALTIDVTAKDPEYFIRLVAVYQQDRLIGVDLQPPFQITVPEIGQSDVTFTIRTVDAESAWAETTLKRE